MAVNEQRLEKDQGLPRGGHEDGSGKRAVNLIRKEILFILYL
jgi:hypothetical protein